MSDSNEQNIIDSIESGKQRGARLCIESDGVRSWCDAAIQKYEGVYKTHISVIKEQNMEAENYDIYCTLNFADLSKAIDFVNTNGHVRFHQFAALEGQKIFNPKGDEDPNSL